MGGSALGGGAGRTVQDVRAVMLAGRETAPAVVRGLFRLRRRIGALFGWDDQRPAWNAESYADRLGPPDRARSLVAPGHRTETSASSIALRTSS